MPNRNIVKLYDADSYYHVYNRGVDKRDIFLDDQDCAVFLGLLKRHLDKKPYIGSQGRNYEWLVNDIEIVAFCLMPNHFHLLLYQIEMGSATKLLRAVCSSYVNYFNKKYERIGPLFQGNFKAVKVNNNEYLLWLTRYVHRNPPDYMGWEWSSLSYWLGSKKSFWVRPQRLKSVDSKEYIAFLKDDDDYKITLEQILHITF